METRVCKTIENRTAEVTTCRVVQARTWARRTLGLTIIKVTCHHNSSSSSTRSMVFKFLLSPTESSHYSSKSSSTWFLNRVRIRRQQRITWFTPFQCSTGKSKNFIACDRCRKGYINKEDLKVVFSLLNENVSEEELNSKRATQYSSNS